MVADVSLTYLTQNQALICVILALVLYWVNRRVRAGVCQPMMYPGKCSYW